MAASTRSRHSAVTLALFDTVQGLETQARRDASRSMNLPDLVQVQARSGQWQRTTGPHVQSPRLSQQPATHDGRARGATRCLLVLQLVCLTACQSDCESAACPSLDTSAHPMAITVPLAPGTVARLTIGEESGVVLLSGGYVRFSASATHCLLVRSSDCEVTLEQLQLELSSITIETNIGTITTEDTTLGLEGPIQLHVGYVLPADSRLHTCGSVDGRDDHGVSSLGGDSRLRLDASSQQLTLDGEFPVVFHTKNGTCDRLEGTVVLLAGGGPWSNSPLHTDAGAFELDAAAPR